ncbi:MAG: hypothetical protein JO199_11905 [Candidatus Eremiobacteraeota bacterium]|nr:hypothetical protein [Candidatus Eremiobacteraeota bacterium]
MPAPIVSPSTAPAATIPLNLNVGDKPGFHLNVRFGNQRGFRPLLFDTGSAGLWIYHNSISASDYTPTTLTVTESYGSGLTYDGILVYAKVDFGNGHTTAASMPIGLVLTASCQKKQPMCEANPASGDCPGLPPGKDVGIRCVEAGRKLFGTAGSDLGYIYAKDASGNAKAEMFNALFGIQTPPASSFAVTPAGVELNPSHAGFALARLAPAPLPPKPLTNGAQAWVPDIQTCFSVPASYTRCLPTLFDTGATSIAFQTPTTQLPLTNYPCGKAVTTGTPVQIKFPDGRLLYDFTAGETTNSNKIRWENKAKNQINTGFTLYNYFDILFDAKVGRIGFKRLTAPAHNFQKGCNG